MDFPHETPGASGAQPPSPEQTCAELVRSLQSIEGQKRCWWMKLCTAVSVPAGLTASAFTGGCPDTAVAAALAAFLGMPLAQEAYYQIRREERRIRRQLRTVLKSLDLDRRVLRHHLWSPEEERIMDDILDKK